MPYQLLVPPIAEPVSLAQAKNFLRVDFADDDMLIGSLARAARAWCESYTERYFVTQTWRLYMDAFPGYEDYRRTPEASVQTGSRYHFGTRWAFSLPFPPCSQVLQVQYQSVYGIPLTLTQGSQYFVDLASQPARVAPAYGTFWPVTQFVPNAAWCDFICGYGSPAVDASSDVQYDANGFYGGWLGTPVPDQIQLAILMLTATYYDTRNVSAPPPDAVQAMLAPYRDMRF